MNDLLEGIISDLGTTVKAEARELAAYMRERAAHLRTLAAGGDPQLMQAARAERDALMLKAGINTVHTADAADEKAFAVLDAALRALASA